MNNMALTSIIYEGNAYGPSEELEPGEPIGYLATKEINGFAVWVVVEPKNLEALAKPEFLFWFSERSRAIETAVDKTVKARMAVKSRAKASAQ